MADITTTETNVTETNPTTDANSTENKAPTVDELLEQLAQERAEREKLKSSNDKLSKSEAEMKRQLRAKLSTEEAEAEARKEAEAKQKEEFENAIAELNKMKATQAYSPVLGEEKAIETMISAVDDKDHNAVALIVKSAIEKAVKQAQAEWLKSRPQPQAGSGYTAMTTEQIMAIEDRNERLKAIAQNMERFRN